MMLDPSIDSLMEVIDSKYMLVTLSAKRAREMQRIDANRSREGASPKYVGTALKEIISGELTYTPQDSK